MSLDALLARNKDGHLDKLIAATKRTTSGKRDNFKEDNTYYPAIDGAGNGQAIIRFLPGLESEDEPIYVETIYHFFKGKGGKWYRENCPTFLGEDCPACDANRMRVDKGGGDFDSLPESEKTLIRKRSRTHHFYANIMVVRDDKNPENNGKVFKFRFGKKILEKIIAAADPKFDGDPSVLVYDYVAGANFKLVIKKVDGYVNYTDSSFDPISEMPAQLIEKVKKEQFPLLPLIDPSRYKKYSALRNTLISAIGAAECAPAPDSNPTFNPDEDVPTQESSAPKDNPFESAVNEQQADTGANDAGQDDMDYFKNLAEESS